jgi:predicted RecA/RadA family phage recombinase
MNSYKQPGDTIELAAPYARNSGEGAQIGSIFGVASRTMANAERGNFMLTGVHNLKKTSAQAWTEGVKIYWDNTAKETTTAAAAGANLFIGHAAGAFANPTATGDVRLHGAGT